MPCGRAALSDILPGRRKPTFGGVPALPFTNNQVPTTVWVARGADAVSAPRLIKLGANVKRSGREEENLHVWVQTPTVSTASAFIERLKRLGLEPCAERRPDAEVALWDLIEYPRLHYPLAPDLPTLAFLEVHEADALMLLMLGYGGYFDARGDGQLLKRALEAVARGELWAERKVITKLITLAYPTTPPRTGRRNLPLKC